MGLIIDARQMLEVEMGVDLSGAEIGVPEKLLNRSQIPARFQQMARKGMSEHVWMQRLRNALPLLPVNQSSLDAAGRESAPSATQENRGLLGSRQHFSQREPSLKGGDGLFSNRHQSRLTALASLNEDRSSAAVKIHEVKIHQL